MAFDIRITERGGYWMKGFQQLGGWRHSFIVQRGAAGFWDWWVKDQDFLVFCVQLFKKILNIVLRIVVR